MEKEKAKIKAKYQVKSISIGMGVGGMSCSGWHPGPEICEIKVLYDKGEEFYLSLADADGCPYYFKTAESTFNNQVLEIEDKSFWSELDKNNISGGCDYEEAFKNLDDDKKKLMPLVHLMANFIRPDKYLFETPEVKVCAKSVTYDYNDDNGRYKGSYKKLLEINKATYDKNRKYRIRGLALQAKYFLEDLEKDFDKLNEEEIKEKIDKIKELANKIKAEKDSVC